mgnify:FL=1
METIKWAVNEMPKTDDSQLQVMSLENVAKASMRASRSTVLHHLQNWITWLHTLD